MCWWLLHEMHCLFFRNQLADNFIFAKLFLQPTLQNIRTANEFVVLIIIPGSSGWEIWSGKYSLIQGRSWQTSLTFHYTKSTYNWPCGPLLFWVLKLKVVVFSSENIILSFSLSQGLSEGPIFAVGSPTLLKVLLDVAPFYAYLKIKGKVEGLMMKIAWSISNYVYSYALTSKASLCFSSSHLAISTKQKLEKKKMSEREEIIGFKSGWIFLFA